MLEQSLGQAFGQKSFSLGANYKFVPDQFVNDRATGRVAGATMSSLPVLMTVMMVAVLMVMFWLLFLQLAVPNKNISEDIEKPA